MSSSPLPKGKELVQKLILADLLKRRGEVGPLDRPHFAVAKARSARADDKRGRSSKEPEKPSDG